MKKEIWTVKAVSQARHFEKNISQKCIPRFLLLLEEIEKLGPYRSNWPNYSKLNGSDDFHCHIKKGRPTYVVCWRIYDKKYKIIEVYYAGTHEKAPY